MNRKPIWKGAEELGLTPGTLIWKADNSRGIRRMASDAHPITFFIYKISPGSSSSLKCPEDPGSRSQQRRQDATPVITVSYAALEDAGLPDVRISLGCLTTLLVAIARQPPKWECSGLYREGVGSVEELGSRVVFSPVFRGERVLTGGEDTENPAGLWLDSHTPETARY